MATLGDGWFLYSDTELSHQYHEEGLPIQHLQGLGERTAKGGEC